MDRERALKVIADKKRELVIQVNPGITIHDVAPIIVAMRFEKSEETGDKDFLIKGELNAIPFLCHKRSTPSDIVDRWISDFDLAFK